MLDSIRIPERAAALAMLALPAAAQSINVDFGDPAGAYGVPAATYGAAGPAGVWNGVSSTPAMGLLDTSGAATGVSLSVSAVPMLDDCGDAGTSGDDEALLDDRWAFDPPSVTLTVSGLAPGEYRVHVYLLLGSCIGMFTPLTVEIAGADPASADVWATWSGSPLDGQTHSTQYKTIGAGDDLLIQTSAPMGFSSYTQHCGLQIVRVEPPSPFCFGDGTDTPCPCGNAGLAGRGCDNSFATGGGLLAASGHASVAGDTLVLSASGLPSAATALLFQFATPLPAASVFGDGLLCSSGPVRRLGARAAVAGTATWPGATPLSVGGAVPVAGGTRSYQCWYRNNVAGFCTPALFNLTNAVGITWLP